MAAVSTYGHQLDQIHHKVLIIGIVHNFFSFVKSHILGYDGVWYSSFWSEGSGNHLN